MKEVESKYRTFPWAFSYPDKYDRSSAEQIGEINHWLISNDLWYNDGYLTFEFSERHRNRYGGVVNHPVMAIAFKDRNKALMFKLAWA